MDQLDGDLAAQGVSFDLVRIPYTMAQLDRWPASCKKNPIEETGESLEEFRMGLLERLNLIPTDLLIRECDADLMEMAAHKIVHDTLTGETLRRLRDHGFAVREVQE